MTKDSLQADADDLFPVGTRVRMTAKTPANTRAKTPAKIPAKTPAAHRSGIVVNQGRTATRVRVLWDGVTAPQTIATKYLEREDAARSANAPAK
jgi:hypothetical protein